MESANFFAELFDVALNSGHKMYIWIPDRGSAYFTDTNMAASYAAENKHLNVYYGLGLTQKELGRDNRPKTTQVSAIPGLWLDIDIAGPAHKKQNLPMSKEDAIDLLNSSLPLPPSILVDSGHGLHAYWLFREPWTFDTEDERQQAAGLLRKFILSFKYHAAVRGWALDSVFDLSRVFRVPGTINTKEGAEVKECKIVDVDYERRYNPDDFYEFMVDTGDIKTEADISSLLSGDKNPLGLFLRPMANPPQGKFEAMSEVESRFVLSWNKKRKDLTDQSFSSYDMSITSLLVSYGWKDQEIADLIIAFRRRHAKTDKEAKKALRVDYITRTILKARKNLEKKAEQETNRVSVNKTLLEITDTSSTTVSSENPDARENIIKALEEVLKINISRVIKYEADNPRYEIILSDGRIIPVGHVDKLLSQRALKSIIAGHCNIVMKMLKAPAWDQYASLLFRLVETVTPAVEDATEKGALISTIQQYLESKGIIMDMDSAIATGRPFWEKERAYIFSSDFVNWTKFNAEPITKYNFSMVAASLSIKNTKMRFKVGPEEKQRRITRTVYDITAFVTSEILDIPAARLVEFESRDEMVQ